MTAFEDSQLCNGLLFHSESRLYADLHYSSVEIFDWLVAMGFGPMAIVIMVAVMAVVVVDSHHAVQCSWAVTAAYCPFTVYSRNAQQFTLLH